MNIDISFFPKARWGGDERQAVIKTL